MPNPEPSAGRVGKLGQWRSNKIQQFRAKLSRNQRVTLDEQIDAILDSIRVGRAMVCQKDIFIKKEQSAFRNTWLLYGQCMMMPTRNSYFMKIEVEGNRINLWLDEVKFGVSIEHKLNHYNWKNESGHDHSGRKQISVDLPNNFDILHDTIVEIMNHLK